MFFFRYLLKMFLKKFAVLFFIFFSFKDHLNMFNIKFQVVCAQISISKSALNFFHPISFFEDIESEVITITENYDFSFDRILSPNFVSQFVPLSDSTDYLKRFPGFSSMRSGGTNSDLLFRGMFGSRLHVLDGNSEIFGACTSRMDSSSAYIFPENFDFISLIKGPQTVLWGPVVSGGVIRFERYNPRFYTSGIKMRASAMIGSYNRLDKNIDTTFGNSFGYLRLIGVMTNSNDYLDAKKNKIPSSWYKWNTNMIIGFTPVVDLLFELTFSQSNGNAKYAAREMDAMCFSRESYEIRLRKDVISDNLSSIDWVFWHHYINHIMDDDIRRYISKSFIKNDSFLKIKPVNNVDSAMLGTRGIFVCERKDLKTSYGLDMQATQHRRKKTNYWYKDFYFQDIGLFVELDWKLALVNKCVGGMRLEHTLVNYHASQEDIKHRTKIYPAGFIRYEHMFLGPLLTTTYFGIGANERFPDYWELVFLESVKGTEKNYFYRLKPEKNVQLDIGTHIKSNKLDIWMSSYFNYIKDFILYRYYDNSKHLILNKYNIDSYAENVAASFRGGELGIGYQLNNNWNIEGNMSYVFGKNITNFSPLPQCPPLEGEILLNWEHGLWNSRFILRMVESQTRISCNEGTFMSKDTVTSRGFSVLSINLSRNITREIKVIFGIDNLLNKNYSEHLNLIGSKRFDYLNSSTLHEPGRTFWGRVTVML